MKNKKNRIFFPSIILDPVLDESEAVEDSDCTLLCVCVCARMHVLSSLTGHQ